MSKHLLTGLIVMGVLSGGSSDAVESDSPPAIPGYALGSAKLPRAPVSLQEVDLLKQVVLFGPDDVRYLRMSRNVLEDQVEDVLDVWYGFVASTPQLVEYFENTDTGQPDPAYLAAVRKRFGQWILDTASGQYDQAWLDYQFEIGRRHHSIGKNKTDGARSVPIIHFRYIPALHYAITTTLAPFLGNKGHSPEDVAGMQEAWRKSVLLQVILWSYPYVRPGEF